MNRGIYAFLEAASPYLVCWSFVFTLVTSIRIAARVRQGREQVPDSAALTELAGLPLTLLQPVAFVWAVVTRDLPSALLFLWWGPGFVLSAAIVIGAKVRGRTVDWHPVRYVISYLCKLYYLAYMVVFYRLHMPGMMFAFSVWIINDQFEKAFMSLDADRLRRTFHDHWVFRILYPTGLLIPWFYPDVPDRVFARGYGIVLLGLWLAGVAHVHRRGRLRELPQDPSLLRNMVYFPRLRR